MASTETTAPLNVAAADETKAAVLYRWFILGLLAFGAVFAFVDRTNIASALAVPEFKDHFQLTNVARGAINSAFFWAYALLQVPMGWAVDRYGVKYPYAIGIVVWSVATLAAAFTHTLPELIAARIVVGAGEAVVVPASYRWIRSNFKENQSGLAVGIYMLGTKLGPALGPVIAVGLIALYGWQAMFLILGVVGLIWLVPWMLFLKNDFNPGPKGAPRAKKAEMPFSVILKSPMVWGSIIINFCYNYFTFYCMTWMPAYFVEKRGLSLEKMSLFAFFSFLGIAIVALAAGWAADKLIERGHDAVAVRKGFVIAGFVVACTELLGILTTNEQMALFWAVVSLSGLGLATANHLVLVRLTLIPVQATGRVTGVQNVSTAIAGIIAPLLSGWLLQVSGGDYTLPMMVIFAYLVVGALTCIVLLRREWAPKMPEEAPTAA